MAIGVERPSAPAMAIRVAILERVISVSTSRSTALIYE